MKKGIALLFLAVLLVQVVSAEIILNDIESSVYNKGEQLSMSGILRNIEVEGGSLEFKLVCEDLEFYLPFSLEAEENEEFKTEPFRIPSAAEGECYVNVVLSFSDVVIEEENSEHFNVSSELKAEGDFQVNIVQVQLGKTLKLHGYITNENVDSEPVTGSATIYFKSKSKVYYVDDVKVSDGVLEHSHTAIDNKPGEYFIDVLVKDSYGNKKLFEDVARFNIVDEVHVFVEPVQKRVYPGSELHLVGVVNTVLGDKVEEGVIQIILEDEIYSLNIKDGKFDYDLKLSEKINAGKHTLIFSFVEEQTGNWGSTERVIHVEAVPSEIRMNIMYESLKPKDVLEAVIHIYDQANDMIENSMKVEIIDSKGETAYLDYIGSGEKFGVEIPPYSAPGIWKLKVSYSGLEAEKEIVIEEVKKVEVEQVNSTLYIKNTGNVDYNEIVSINLNGDGFVFTKKVHVKPKETLTIDLTKEAPSGQYDVKVTGLSVKDNNFDDVIIVGKNKKSLNFIYSALIILIIASLSYLSIFKRRYFKSMKTRRLRDTKHAQQMLKKLKNMKEESKKPTFSREQSVSEFRERILNDIRETEEKIKDDSSSSEGYDSSSSDEKKKDDMPGGMFNMFG